MARRRKELEWGETPFDRMPREQLSRETQRLFSAVISLNTALGLVRCGDPEGPYWSERGTGGAALEKARQALTAGYGSFDPENVYRSFFRYADDLLFEANGFRIGFGWCVCPTCGTMIGSYADGTSSEGKPCPAFDGKHEDTLRPLQWSDLSPKAKEVV